MSKFILKRIIAAGVGSIGIYDPAELRGPSNKNILFVRTDLDHTDMVDPRQTRFVTTAELVEQHAKATLQGVLVRLRPKIRCGFDEHRSELGVIAGGRAWRG